MKPTTLETLLNDQKERIYRNGKQNDILDYINDINNELKDEN